MTHTKTYDSIQIQILDSGSSNSISFGGSQTSGELEVHGFDNCPFCMKTDELSLTWEKTMTSHPPYEYVFDVTLLCRGCGVIMDENGLDMAGAISSLHERWNRRSKRDDFSSELFKARMYDKQEKWAQEELAKWGPFSVEDMEDYFDKSVFQLIRIILANRSEYDSFVRTSQNEMAYLRAALNDATSGNADISKKLERLFYSGGGRTGSIGQLYEGQAYNGRVSFGVPQEDGRIHWSALGENHQLVTHEYMSPDAMDNYLDSIREVGVQAAQVVNGFAEGLRNAFSDAAPRMEEMLEKWKDAIPKEDMEKLLEAAQQAARDAEREESRQKAVLRSQRNQRQLTMKKGR